MDNEQYIRIHRVLTRMRTEEEKKKKQWFVKKKSNSRLFLEELERTTLESISIVNKEIEQLDEGRFGYGTIEYTRNYSTAQGKLYALNAYLDALQRYLKSHKD